MSRRYTKGKKISEQSQRWWKAKRIVQKLNLRVAHVRKDWVEQVSNDLLKRYDVIAIEQFDVREMVSRKVKYRKGRRKILDIGWGMLRSAIKRKAEARGKICEDRGKVAPTDQTCSRCGARNERVDGLFRCPNESCQHNDTRPRNTADLLYRVAIGDPPEEFPGICSGSPAGEAGVKTRGACQERSSGCAMKRDQMRTTPDRGRGEKTAPTTPTRGTLPQSAPSAGGSRYESQERRNARKSRSSSHNTPRACARIANPQDLEEAAE
jgi:IS605 OrfB family transposase